MANPYTCPRCGNTNIDREFYGPCDNCAAQLNSAGTQGSGDYSKTEFEPAMNVVPNQIASKE